jgi:hypothetical protein
LLKNLHEIKTKATDWLDYIHYRITNSDDYVLSYKKSYLSASSPTVVKQYLEQFIEKNPEKVKAIEHILDMLRKPGRW